MIVYLYESWYKVPQNQSMNDSQLCFWHFKDFKKEILGREKTQTPSHPNRNEGGYLGSGENEGKTTSRKYMVSLCVV